MSQPGAPHEAIGALERLYAKNVITLEEGQAAARLIMKDDAYVFPPPPRPAPGPERSAEAPAKVDALPADASGNGDGSPPA